MIKAFKNIIKDLIFLIGAILWVVIELIRLVSNPDRKDYLVKFSKMINNNSNDELAEVERNVAQNIFENQSIRYGKIFCIGIILLSVILWII